MKAFNRRAALAAACITALMGSTAMAQAPAAWPTKPVRIWVPSPAGTAPDIVARVMGDKLSKAWGQPVIIENRPGAGGMIGLGAIKSGTQDDHTFAMVPASVITLSPYMYKTAQVDVVKDFVPVALVAEGPMMMAVSASSPANSLADVMAMAKKDGEKFVVTSPLMYSVPHLAGEVLGKAAGIPMRAVPYANSGAAIAAVMNNDAQIIIDGIPPIEPMVKGGKLKAIAVFSEARLANRPQIATVAETYPGMVINGWFGIIAPKGTSNAAIERMNRDVVAAARTPELTERFDTFGVYAKGLSPAQFGKYWNDDLVRWEKVLKDIGAKPQQ
ncbi:MAG: tripartite tricarboxylate transporter substrate binding protein [Polaromonas sp.]|uniref:Bug family tripartite tricarboxylate transporter substrate binding protein n=1 Tax=Polaromonas sp. TaxID=1869339 RepID=UPI0025D09D22|nr:tripartite tricarboxylate transporter substrate binding protein [Polaromonas sp.]MBI2726980.1 tripartite tricarboxylate transporter substrate binding protein [Polaromonas sp.]